MLALALALALLGGGSCSLLLKGDADQCTTDADCARFAGSICSTDHVCVTAGSSSSGSSGTGSSGGGAGACDGGGGCWPCAPVTNAQIQNACTGAVCAKFDAKRLTKALKDGGLPPLP